LSDLNEPNELNEVNHINKQAHERTERQRTLIFINLMITCIAVSMLATALTTALPAIVTDLQISVTTGQWLTSGYSLAMAIVMPLTAYLMNRVPTKKLYLSALGIALIGLLLCAGAPNFFVMMLARILQAIGNGILTAMAQVILLTIYPMNRIGVVMGWYGLSITAAPVIAPTLAGVIVDRLNWHAIFYIVAAIVLLSLIWAIRVFDDVLPTAKSRFDQLSFVLSAFAFGGVTLGFGNIGSYGFVSVPVLGALGIGLLAGIWFVLRQFRSTQPFLDLQVLKTKEYAISVFGSILLYLVLMGSAMLMPLYVQSILGKSATISGLVILPGSLVSALLSPIAGRIYDKIGIRLLTIFGGGSLVLSNIGMYFVHMDSSIWLAVCLNILRCAATGCLLMPFVTWGNKNIAPELTAHGTALLTSLRTVAGAIGTALFVGIMNSVAQKSTTLSGAAALLHGMNVSFLLMTIASGLLFATGLFLIRDKQDTTPVWVEGAEEPIE